MSRIEQQLDYMITGEGELPTPISRVEKQIAYLIERGGSGGDMTTAVYDPDGGVADAGGIAWYVAEEVSGINEKISPYASSSNKLVSASEMGDAIEAVEAKQLYATSAQGSFATKSALTSATVFYNADGTVATPTKNDVAYILADESHSGKSAKYVIANEPSDSVPPVWGFVITFSDATFTQAQMDAINSGVTSAKRSGYDTHVSDGDIHVTAAQKTAWSGKQDALVSGTNIKTINGNSILGSGNMTVSGLPAYTTSDNGKFLRVVNGSAAWQTVPSAENSTF